MGCARALLKIKKGESGAHTIFPRCGGCAFPFYSGGDGFV